MRLSIVLPTVSTSDRFSPVAGIQWVESLAPGVGCSKFVLLSIVLPTVSTSDRFSPVAGIQWVETRSHRGYPLLF